MEQNLTLIWIAAFVGAFAYFLLKARKNAKDAAANGIPFDFGKALIGDWFEILVAFGLVYWYLETGGKGVDIPGLANLDFTNMVGSFAAGLVIAYIGVNYALGLLDSMLNAIPAVNVKLADRTRRNIRNEVKEANG